jgi:diguanylate cyclase (GGDEF)-like protein
LVREAIESASSSGKPYELEHRICRPDGLEITVHQQGEVFVDEVGKVHSLLGTIQDISERKAAEALIEYQAYYDSLTDLPNRRLFTDLLTHAISVAHHQVKPLTLLFLGIDRFKVVNDTLGHAAGDQLLQEIAKRMRASVGEEVSIARFGADIFAILLEEGRASGDVASYASALLTQLGRPVSLHGQEIYTTASMGIALYPHDGEDAENLLKAADSAMSRAKESGGQQYHYFTADMNTQAQQRLQIEGELRRAIENGEFQLFYQPQVDAASHRLVGMEALIRWNHPQKGVISPQDFIPVAEQSGLIVPIGEWVLRVACMETAKWNRDYGLNLRVGVNLSARQFMQPELIEVVEASLRESCLPSHCLDLEVTESIAMDDIHNTIATLERLNGMGIHSSMDDFGTGYSSLSYLQQMPLHTLKIDRAFIMNIEGDGKHGEIALAIIAMAHSLGMQVIAEGVENEQQAAFLCRHQCDLIQGFYISEPLPQRDFERYLTTQAEAADR